MKIEVSKIKWEMADPGIDQLCGAWNVSKTICMEIHILHQLNYWHRF